MKGKIKKKISEFRKFFDGEKLIITLLLGYLVGLLGWLGLNKKDLNLVLENNWDIRLSFFIVVSILVISFLIWRFKRWDSKKILLLGGLSFGLIMLPEIKTIFPQSGFFSFLRSFLEAPWDIQAIGWVWIWALFVFWFADIDKIRIKKPVKILKIMVAVFWIVFAAQGLILHRELGTLACDYGIYDQTLWQMAYNHSLINTVNNFGHAFGAHFQPILFLLAPFYWLWNNAGMLILLEVSVVALGAIPVFRIAQRRFGNNVFSLSLVFAYLMFVGNRGALSFPFHPSTFLAPMLLLAYDYFEQRKWGWHLLFLVLSLMAKENASNYIALWGLFLLVFKREHWKIGLGYIFLGIGWLALVTKIIIPYFIGVDYGFFFYHTLGENQLAGLVTLARNPLYVIKIMFDNPVKINTFLSITGGGGFLVFLSPYVLFMMPGLVEQLTSEKNAMWVNWVYYSGPVVFGYVLAILGGVGFLIKKKFLGFDKNKLLIFCSLLIVLSTLVMVKKYRFTPVLHDNKIIKFEQRGELDGAIKMLSDRASVSAHSNVLPQIAHRPKIYRFPTVEDANYILLITNYTSWPLEQAAYKQSIRDLLASEKWGLIYSKKDILLFKKNSSDQSIASLDVVEYLQQ